MIMSKTIPYTESILRHQTSMTRRKWNHNRRKHDIWHRQTDMLYLWSRLRRSRKDNSNVQCSWSLELPLRVLPTAASEKRSQNEVAIRRTYLEHAKLLSRERNYELVSDLVVEEKLYINFNQQFKSLKQVLKPTTAAIRQIHWSSNGQHAKKTPSLFSRCSVTWFHHFIRDLITHDQGRSFELSCWWPGRELDRFTGKLIQKKTLTRKYFTNFGTSYRSFYWKTHPDQIS